MLKFKLKKKGEKLKFKLKKTEFKLKKTELKPKTKEIELLMIWNMKLRILQQIVNCLTKTGNITIKFKVNKLKRKKRILFKIIKKFKKLLAKNIKQNKLNFKDKLEKKCNKK